MTKHKVLQVISNWFFWAGVVFVVATVSGLFISCSQPPLNLSSIESRLKEINAKTDQALALAQADKVGIDNLNALKLPDQIIALSNKVESMRVGGQVLPAPAQAPASADLTSRISALEGKQLTTASQLTALSSSIAASLQQGQNTLNDTMVKLYASKTDIANLQMQLNNMQAPAVTAIISQMSVLQAQINTILAQQANFQAWYNQLSTMVGQVNQLVSLGNTITALQTTVTDIQAQLNTLTSSGSQQTQINQLASSVQNAQTAVANMQSQVNTLIGQMTTAQSQILTMQGQIADLQNRLLSHGW